MEEQDYIVFENYLLEALSEAEKNAFEARLNTDTKFKESFNTYKELSSFLKNKFENESASTAFQENLKSISNNYFGNQKTSKKIIKFKPWQYAVAASIALLIGIVMFNNFSTPVYSDYANYESISLTVRGGQDGLLKTAENAFNTKDFAKAEIAFKELLITDENNTELQFYRGVTNIELNNYALADWLLKGLKEGNSVYKNKATWYLALSKLKQKDYDATLEILKTIPKEAEDYEAAQKLINKLD
ncbi:tol-pal system YbgF family protein [Mariniflexile sp.]|uniref:tetratricopeptide repeat protein n=1 Tax=Mariniflexile sp. TaxID=1979402 RepID=UPI003568F4E5